ncbi:MAG: inositol monophosphatase family protein [Solirubrobacteraceae bacterium]
MDPADEVVLLAVAWEAAEAAADELRSRFGLASAGVRAKTTPTDLVSEADVAAERAIRKVLARRRPGDAILGEEGGASGDGALRWIVDPLDGTVNYLFGYPHFAVSVACEDRAGALSGVVLDVVRGERFGATRSGSATLDGEVVAPRTPASALAFALLATGFDYDASLRSRQADVLSRVLPRVRDVRRSGSAALDLVWCACGRLDAYYERGVHEWDIAAGVLIAERAGLVVRRLEPRGDEEPWGVLAAPAEIFDELAELVTAPGAPELD